MMIFDRYYAPDMKKYVYSILGFKYFVTTKYRRIQRKANRYQRKLEFLHSELQSQLDISKLSPADGELRRTQLKCLELLKIVDDVCRTSNLEYWIDFGTLLGAVRHGGFVPWDNDIDLAMPRSSFEKIADLLQPRFEGTEYTVRTAGYSNHFQIRICNKDNTIGLDIFSVDFCETIEAKEVITANVKKARKELELIYPRQGENTVIFDIESIRKNIHAITDRFICKKAYNGGG